MAGVQDFGGGPEQELTFSHDGQELHCFLTSRAHGDSMWAVTIGNRTFCTWVRGAYGQAPKSVLPDIIEWYEAEKARGTFE